MKERWTVEFEIDVDLVTLNDGTKALRADFEADENMYRSVRDDGIINWWYGTDTVIFPWKLIKREKL